MEQTLGVTSILAPLRSSAVARRERFGVAAAAAATPVASLARAPTRHHANRRGLLYLRLAVPSFPEQPTMNMAR